MPISLYVCITIYADRRNGMTLDQTEKLAFLGVGALITSCIVGWLSAGYMPDFSTFSLLNEKDVVEHLGYLVEDSNDVPEGQTVKFKVYTQFIEFIDFLERIKPSIVYYVGAKPNITPLTEGAALYFVSDGIIYLYQ